MAQHPLRSTLFPYTTLFRSGVVAGTIVGGVLLRRLPEFVFRRVVGVLLLALGQAADRKSTRLNSSHANISYAVFCLKKKTRGAHLQFFWFLPVVLVPLKTIL